MIEFTFNITFNFGFFNNRKLKGLFGLMRPKVVVLTTPNGEYNVLFKNFSGMRHYDHKFEWTRFEFESWCNAIATTYCYDVEYGGIGEPPPAHQSVGYCSQMAVFTLRSEKYKQTVPDDTAEIHSYLQNSLSLHDKEFSNYESIIDVIYPYEDLTENRGEKILNEIQYLCLHRFSSNIIDDDNGSDEVEKDNIVTIDELMEMNSLKQFKVTKHEIIDLLVKDSQRTNCWYSLPDQKDRLVIPYIENSRDPYFDDGDDDDYDDDYENDVGDAQEKQTGAILEEEMWDSD